MKPFFLASVLVLASFQAIGQTPYLVKDINTYRTDHPSSSNPYGFTALGSKILFAANNTNTVSNSVLYALDGDTVTNLSTAIVESSPAEQNWVVLNGKMLYCVREGERLWVTDGTPAGTHQLADVSGLNAFQPGGRVIYHGKLFFAGRDTVHGDELWVTDGTAAGTTFFKALGSGTHGSNPNSFVIFHDTIYFLALDGLWKSDGTPEGTVNMKSFPAGGAVSTTSLMVVGSQMIFDGFTPENGYEPWVSDGTTEGTHVIADINPGPNSSSFARQMTPVGNRVLFKAFTANGAPEELWVTDGTAAGTHRIGAQADLTSVAVAGDTAYFSAAVTATGQELWKSDGTEAGTILVADLNPGTSSSSPANFASMGGKAYFLTSALSAVNTLWVTDGTAAGTHPVKTSGLTTPRAFSSLSNAGGTLYFSGSNDANGFEVWKSDGSDAGTAMVANVRADSAPWSAPESLTVAGDWVYFLAWDGFDPIVGGSGQKSLWRSDGTAEGTLKLTTAPGSFAGVVGRTLFYTRNNVLWKTDGTPETTTIANEFASRFPASPIIRAVLGDTVFVTSDGKLYATNAAAGSPAILLGTSPDGEMVPFAGRMLYFLGNLSNHAALWSTDGTAAGTFAVVPDAGGPASAYATSVMGGHLYFRISYDPNTQLWKTDGTFEGTVMVKQFPGPLSNVVAIGKRIFFSQGNKLWISDGTDAGTQIVTQTPNVSSSLMRVGERVLFPVFVSEEVTQLWSSDGTAEGTKYLHDIDDTNWLLTEPPPGHPAFFRQSDAQHGSELWTTDGTVEGTHLVADIEPGTGSSIPYDFTQTPDRLFFSALTTATGYELWSMPLATSPQLSAGDTHVNESDTDNVAHFTVTLAPASNRAVTVDYATADDSATAGSDYDAASGTLTFAPGETSKSIDVHVKGDTTPESNESFFLTLKNASGAAIARSTAFALIDDDDQIADVALALDTTTEVGFKVGVKATNSGPRAATSIKLQVTQTPSGSGCQGACDGPLQLASGQSARAYTDSTLIDVQRYVTVTASAHQRDPNPANNTAAYTTRSDIAMDALYLTPGATAHIYFNHGSNPVSVESSNPAVVIAPAAADASGVFTVQGGATGTSVIRVYNASSTIGSLSVDVLAPGTKPRWPGAIGVVTEPMLPYDRLATFRVVASGTAPFDGKSASGTVTLTMGSREIGRLTLDSTQRTYVISTYAEKLGANPITATYSGDGNFTPMTASGTLYSGIGSVSIGMNIQDGGTSATLHVRVIGSPMSAPTGSVSVQEVSSIPVKTVPLTPESAAVSVGDVTLTGLTPGVHTFRVSYTGDAFYNPGTQEFREVSLKKPAARH